MVARPFALLARLALLVPLFLVTFFGGAALFAPAVPAGVIPEAGPLAPLPTALIVAATHVGVVALVILRSRLDGWRLALVASVAYYGCTTFLAQVETGFFLLGRTVPAEALRNLFLMGLPPAMVFVPAAAWTLAPLRPAYARDPAPRMPLAQWGWKLPVLSVAYLGLYVAAGYYIAWRNPDLRALYGGTDPGGFLPMLGQIASLDPWIIPLQFVRGLGWIAFVLPVVRASRPGPWANALAAACLVALPMNVAHLFPNPFIPVMSVRLSHFLETASSNFVFGLLVGWLLHRSHASWRDLFGTAPQRQALLNAASTRAGVIGSR